MLSDKLLNIHENIYIYKSNISQINIWARSSKAGVILWNESTHNAKHDSKVSTKQVVSKNFDPYPNVGLKSSGTPATLHDFSGAMESNEPATHSLDADIRAAGP